MPLTSPAPRRLAHTRTIECHGYEREDGLWDIEGHLTDVKTAPHGRPDGSRPVEPGEPVHDMWLRLTIDLDYRIHRAEALTEVGRYPMCGDAAPNFAKLEGLVIGRGFKKAATELVGGAIGCTHLSELLGRMATTAYQATNQARYLREGYNSERHGKRLVGTCRAYAATSPVVLKRWPNLYTGPSEPS